MAEGMREYVEKATPANMATSGEASTGIGLGAGLGGVGTITGILGLLGALWAGNRAGNVANGAIPAGLAMGAMANGGIACNDHNKTCVSRDTFDLYREGCQNDKDSIIRFASLADRQAQQFAGIGNMIWEDRLQQSNATAQTNLALASIASNAECCCKLTNQKMDYENQITRMMMAQGFESILCKMPSTTPVYYPNPIVNFCPSTTTAS